MSSAFQSEKFRAAQFEARTESFTLEQLREFFADDTEPKFTVRGLTAAELHRCLEAGTRQNAVESVVKAIASQRDQVDSIRKALGLSSDTPGETAKRIEMLVLGSVTPKLDHADVVKLAEVCPIEFIAMTNAITQLTGQGGSRVKPKPSSPATPD